MSFTSASISIKLEAETARCRRFMAAKTQIHKREEDYPPPDVFMLPSLASLPLPLLLLWRFHFFLFFPYFRSFDKSLSDEEFIWHCFLSSTATTTTTQIRNFRFDFRPMSVLLLLFIQYQLYVWLWVSVFVLCVSLIFLSLNAFYTIFISPRSMPCQATSMLD